MTHLYIVRSILSSEDEESTIAYAYEKDARHEYDNQCETCSECALELHRFDFDIPAPAAARIWNQRSHGWNRLERFNAETETETETDTEKE